MNNEIFNNLIIWENVPNIHRSCIVADVTTNCLMIGELSTNQKLDNNKYDIWHWEIQYLLNEKKLLEPLTITKSLPSEKDKFGKLIDATNM